MKKFEKTLKNENKKDVQQLFRLETRVDDLIGDMCPYSSLPNFLFSFYNKVTHD